MSKKESSQQIMTKLKEETSLDVSVEERNYLNQLTDIQKIAYSIAKEHLESSFDLEKSIGFKQWMESNKK